MPKKNSKQLNALTILDYLYFYDIVNLQTYTNEKGDFYKYILSNIELISKKRGFKDEKYEAYKHFLLCYLEVENSPVISCDLEGKEKVQTILEDLLQYIERNKFSKKDFIFDVKKLVLDCNYYLNTPRKYMYHNLVSQMLFYEYDSITTGVFLKFIWLGILQTKKHQINKVEIGEGFLNSLFCRAMLFIEYQIFKDNGFLEIEDNIKKTSLIKFDCQDERAERYEYYKYKRNNFEFYKFKSILEYKMIFKKEIQKQLHKGLDRISENDLLVFIRNKLELVVFDGLMDSLKESNKEIPENIILEKLERIDFENQWEVEIVDENHQKELIQIAKEELILEFYQLIDSIEKNEIEYYLKNIVDILGHQNIFSDNIAKWVGLTAGWHILYQDLFKRGRSLYRTDNNDQLEDSVAQEAKKIFQKYGFLLQENSFYNYHKKLLSIYQLIRNEVDVLVEINKFGVLEQNEIIYFFYNKNSNLDMQLKVDDELLFIKSNRFIRR